MHGLDVDPEEVERLAARAAAYEHAGDVAGVELEQVRHELDRLLNALEFYSPDVREELRADPERALRICREARDNASSLTSPAGYVIARFRSGYDPAAPLPHELPPEPLTIAEHEAGLAWARARGAPAALVLLLEQGLEQARAKVAAD